MPTEGVRADLPSPSAGSNPAGVAADRLTASPVRLQGVPGTQKGPTVEAVGPFRLSVRPAAEPRSPGRGDQAFLVSQKILSIWAM